MADFGLIGYPLGHSFSQKYFEKKFRKVGLTGNSYQLFELPDITLFPDFLSRKPQLKGLSVTIPHKQAIIPYLDSLDPVAEKIGAVNTISITASGLIGYNTDWVGFRESLIRFLPPGFAGTALVLGTGGSSKAVTAALDTLGILWSQASRHPKPGKLAYTDIDADFLSRHLLIINTTPLGMAPNVTTAPDLPYQHLTPGHYLFDLVYNPAETLFMQKGRETGAKVKNGLEMLHLQADAAWHIWQQNP